jgi:hypothetical protein
MYITISMNPISEYKGIMYIFDIIEKIKNKS